MAAMVGVWLEAGELQVRDDLPMPLPAEGEALVRVLLAGICNTDLELVRGYVPYRGVLGHEFVGVVEEGRRDLVGRRVVGEINAVCGSCRACVAGRRNHCEQRTVLGIAGRDGAFADFLTLPIENLHLVPEAVGDEAAVFTEPLAAAVQVQEQVPVQADDRVLVIGDGKLGQLVARTLRLTGCRLTAVGRHRRKLEPLAGLGAEVLLEAELAENGFDDPFDVAVECTGNADGFELARRGLRARGTLVLKSTYAGSLTLDAASLVVDEITVVGSRCGPFEPALCLLADRRVEVEGLIDDRYPLSRALEAFDHAGRSGALKILLAPDACS